MGFDYQAIPFPKREGAIQKVKRGDTIITKTQNKDDEYLTQHCEDAGKQYSIEHHRGCKVRIDSIVGSRAGIVHQWKEPDERYIYLESDISDNEIKVRVTRISYR